MVWGQPKPHKLGLNQHARIRPYATPLQACMLGLKPHTTLPPSSTHCNWGPQGPVPPLSGPTCQDSGPVPPLPGPMNWDQGPMSAPTQCHMLGSGPQGPASPPSSPTHQEQVPHYPVCPAYHTGPQLVAYRPCDTAMK